MSIRLSVAEIMADVSAEIVISALSNSDTDDIAIKHDCFRIKNLLDEELVKFVELWPDKVPPHLQASTELVVGSSLGGRIPFEFVADDDKSITYYRNNINPGAALVYLETEDQSDAQGLQNFFTLRDSNFLDGSFDRFVPGESVPELVLNTAFSKIRPHTALRALLRSLISEVITTLHTHLSPLPIRKYVEFCNEVVLAWDSYESAGKIIDEPLAIKIVGKCLPYLDLFQDEAWRDSQSSSKTKRRLDLNARHADLRTTTGEIDPDNLIQQILNKDFIDIDKNPLTPEENREWRSLCVDYASRQSKSLLKEIPYFIFEQLFSKDSKGVALGDRVHQEIEERDASRLNEYENLDVSQGLNHKQQAAAETFLNSTNSDQLVSLVDLLTTTTRKMVERVAFPRPKAFRNPLVETVRFLDALSTNHVLHSAEQVTLELAADASKVESTLGLFNFLYRDTFCNLASQSIDDPLSLSLVLDQPLQSIIPPPDIQFDGESGGDAEEEADQDLWGPLLLKWTIKDCEGKVLEESEIFEWVPSSIDHLALFWILSVDENSPLHKNIGNLLAENYVPDDDSSWFQSIINRTQGLSNALKLNPSDLITLGNSQLHGNLIACRQQFFSDCIEKGLSIESINNYFDDWTSLINSFRKDFIPNGKENRYTKAFLGSDFVVLDNTRMVCLPTHAHRLRWIASYLNQSAQLLKKYLDRNINFSAGDSQSYFDWLEERQPRETPPLCLSPTSEIYFPKYEYSWFEQFSAISVEAGGFGDDQQAVTTLVKRISSYLQAHPYKRDGLSILFVRPPSNWTVANVVSLLQKNEFKNSGRLNIKVLTNHQNWEVTAKNVERVSVAESDNHYAGIFPPCDLTFAEFDPDNLTSILNESYDLAIVINLLKGSMTAQQNTEPLVSSPGHFFPLLDKTTQMTSSGEAGATSIILKPKSQDITMDDWGTMVVRSHRTTPVSPAQPENVDFVELRLNFSDFAPVFNALHENCHWVMTLERHISRRQIESFEAGAPDILSVSDGIGANGLGTLIVSSKSGRQFIESRLRRKLKNLVDCDASNITTESRLAEAIYDETRWISPHLALTAMGISRVTEEILGISVARNVAEYFMPPPDRPGFATWLSLDEYTDWFGGAASVRADLCRFFFWLDSDNFLHVEALVLEGKLRKAYDPHGVKQAAATSEFFENILGTSQEKDSRNNIDAALWRDRIFSAIDLCADKASQPLSTSNAPQIDELKARIRVDFREGRYSLDRVAPLFSICLWESSSPEIEVDDLDGVTIVRTSRNHILPLISGGKPEPVFFEKINAYRDSSDRPPSKNSRNPISDDISIESYDTGGPRTMPLDAVAIADNESSSIDTPKLDSIKSTPVKNGMAFEALKAMYVNILDCYSAHGVAVQAAKSGDTPFVEGPASILFKVSPGMGVDPRKLYEKSDAIKLLLKLENEQSVAFGIDRGFVTIDVPKSTEHRYFVEAENLWRRWSRPSVGLSVPLGEDRYGQVVELNFSSDNSPHLLVGGTTGSGKSEALNTILYGLVRSYSHEELRLLLVDPKGTELEDFERFEHVLGDIGWDDDDAIALLTGAVDEMQQRLARFKAAKVRKLSDYNAKPGVESIPWWLIVLDEYGDLTSEKDKKKEIEHNLKRLAQKARSVGIHVIVATQKPSAEVISTNVRSNLPAQLALRVKSTIESRVIMDEGGAESLTGKGDAYLKADGKLIRVQCAMVTNPKAVEP